MILNSLFAAIFLYGFQATEKHSYPVCDQVPIPRPCKGSANRYYYDCDTSTCKLFIANRCGGNDNSFDSVDACESECVDRCLANPCEHICTNTPGGFECSCNDGYQVSSGDVTHCQDIDECQESTSCAQECINTDGSFQCGCKDGYKVNANDATKCDDIDECEDSTLCEHSCVNTDGSFQCTCRPGYVVSATDPAKCEDIDECEDSTLCEHSCVNTDGSFECTCRPGYVVSAADPTKCEDKDECLESPCQQTCNNNVGSYTCSCNAGYTVSPTDPSKCEVSGCPDPEVVNCHSFQDHYVYNVQHNNCFRLGTNECSLNSNNYLNYMDCFTECVT